MFQRIMRSRHIPTGEKHPTPHVVRRAYLTEAAEPLAVGPSPIEAAARFGMWLDTTGISPDWSITSPLSGIPLPVYPAHWPDQHRRWPGVKPEMMWHPLMWLPKRVAERYIIEGADASRVEEDDELWSVRVGLELAASGMYDQESGTWVDVLSMYGLDSTKAATVLRVQNWLDGCADPVLDTIDLTEDFQNKDDPDWAVHAAIGEIAALRIVSWATTADGLLDSCDDLTDPDLRRDLDLDRARFHAGIIAKIAGSNFATIPTDTEAGAADEQDWWDGMTQLAEYFAGTVDDLCLDLVEVMAGRLEDIRSRYWPVMESLVDDGAVPG